MNKKLKHKYKRAFQLAGISSLVGWVASSITMYASRLYLIKSNVVAIAYALLSTTFAFIVYYKYYDSFVAIKSSNKEEVLDSDLILK